MQVLHAPTDLEHLVWKYAEEKNQNKTNTLFKRENATRGLYLLSKHSTTHFPEGYLNFGSPQPMWIQKTCVSVHHFEAG